MEGYMMAQALNLLFWGHLFVALRIDFGVDLLPDPLGYLFIAIGCFKLQDHFSIAQRAGIFSVIMIFVSLPTFFIDVHKITGLGWETYALILMGLHLVLTYFTFLILKDITKNYDTTMIERTQRNFILYISTHLIQLAFITFSMNIPENISLAIGLTLAIIVFIMTISFLILIRAIRRTSTRLH